MLSVDLGAHAGLKCEHRSPEESRDEACHLKALDARAKQRHPHEEGEHGRQGIEHASHGGGDEGLGCGEEVGGHEVANAPHHHQPGPSGTREVMPVPVGDGGQGKSGDGDSAHGHVQRWEQWGAVRGEQRNLHQDERAAPDESKNEKGQPHGCVGGPHEDAKLAQGACVTGVHFYL